MVSCTCLFVRCPPPPTAQQSCSMCVHSKLILNWMSFNTIDIFNSNFSQVLFGQVYMRTITTWTGMSFAFQPLSINHCFSRFVVSDHLFFLADVSVYPSFLVISTPFPKVLANYFNSPFIFSPVSQPFPQRF